MLAALLKGIDMYFGNSVEIFCEERRKSAKKVEKVKKVMISVKVKQNDLRVSMFHEVRGERRQEPWTTQEGSFDRITHKSYQSLMYVLTLLCSNAVFECHVQTEVKFSSEKSISQFECFFYLY